MEVIWRTSKVVDQGVITAISWEAEAWEGVFHYFDHGTASLKPAPDAPDYIRHEWVERDQLQPWLFAIIDRDAVESDLIAKVKSAQRVAS